MERGSESGAVFSPAWPGPGDEGYVLYMYASVRQ